MKTRSEVEPALMKGSGKPVGGIEPVNISYCTMNFCKQKRASLLLNSFYLSKTFSFVSAKPIVFLFFLSLNL